MTVGRLLVRSVPLEESRPLSDLVPAQGHSRRRQVAWLHGDEGLVGWGEAARYDAGAGSDRLDRAATWFRDLVAAADTDDKTGAPVAVGSFTFDERAHGSVLVVPAVTVRRRAGRTWLILATADGDPPEAAITAVPPADSSQRIRYAGSSMPDVHWLEAVAVAVDRIRHGDLDKVVLARDHAVWSREPFDSRLLLRRLVTTFPDCYAYLCEGLIGATPELLVRRTGSDVESIVLAGSARRDPDPQADAAIGRDLLASDKDRSEHEMAAASVRDVLSARCRDLQIDPGPSLLRLANVQHLATHCRGRLDPSAAGIPSALDVASALHPTAAVGGTPRAAAIDVIRELEGMDRGRYAGPVGWVDANGDGEFGIALRCAQLSGARARLFAGSGIVAASLPEAELEETRLKLRAMQSAFDA